MSSWTALTWYIGMKQIFSAFYYEDLKFLRGIGENAIFKDIQHSILSTCRNS